MKKNRPGINSRQNSIQDLRLSTIVYSNEGEKKAQEKMVGLLKNNPLPDSELLMNLGLYLTSKNLSRLLFFYEIYKKIINTQGVIMEFGTRWGQITSALSALRGIFEPFNRTRKIVGFDTFCGHIGINKKDGRVHNCKDGDYAVPDKYEGYLEDILKLQEALNPLGHLKKFELVKGDAAQTLPAYLGKHPETIISLAVFDMDIYTPTKAVLEAIKPCLCRGSVVVFDNLCEEVFPGETLALKEVFGLNNINLQRLPMTSRLAYMVIK